MIKRSYWLGIVLCGMYLAGCSSHSSEVQTSRIGAKQLSAPATTEGFNFAVFSDRTGGDFGEGTQIWRQAIDQANKMQPDFVFTVGDLIWGYGDRKTWIEETEAFLKDTAELDVPLYPVAGNHDVYWYRDTKDRPKDHHESAYETHYGPLWYAFEYQNTWFIALYSDEGDHETGSKNYNDPALQKMSDQQFTWLKETLQKAKDAEHIFLFLHHPRWLGMHYGDSWDKVHQLLKKAGNVTAVFAGHYHRMLYEEKDGIDYYMLATTGGAVSQYSVDDQHFWHWVSVQPDSHYVSAIPIGAILDIKDRRMESVILTPETAWDIQSADQVVEFEISTKDYQFEKGKVDVCIIDNFDESGDKQLEAALLDADRNLIHKGKSGEKGEQWVSFPANANTAYYLQLQDSDASFTGDNAGNQGEIKIILSYYTQAGERDK